jgi:hypothetical protein
METQHNNSTDSEPSEFVDKLIIKEKQRSGAAKGRARRARLEAAKAPQGDLALQTGPLDHPHTIEGPEGDQLLRIGTGGSGAPEMGPSGGRARGAGASFSGNRKDTGRVWTDTNKGSRKRNRVSGETPPSAKPKTKRPRPADKPKSAVDEAFKVCVFCEGFPLRRLTDTQLKTLVKNLEDAVFKTAEPGNEVPDPSFEEFRTNRGILYVDCLNQQSTEWLRVQVGGLKIDGMSLQHTLARDLPKPRRAIIHIQGTQEEPNVMLARLKLLNQGLGIDSWHVYGSERVGSSMTRTVVGLWRPHVDALRGLDFKMRYGISRATVKLLGGDRTAGQEGDEPGPSNG